MLYISQLAHMVDDIKYLILEILLLMHLYTLENYISHHVHKWQRMTYNWMMLHANVHRTLASQNQANIQLTRLTFLLWIYHFNKFFSVFFFRFLILIALLISRTTLFQQIVTSFFFAWNKIRVSWFPFHFSTIYAYLKSILNCNKYFNDDDFLMDFSNFLL